MQYLKTIVFVLLAGVHLGSSAPRQGSFLLVPSVPFNFPEVENPQEEPKENPEPRHLVVEQPEGELTQKDLEQLLRFSNELGQTQVQARKFGFHHKSDSDKDKDKDKDRFPYITLVVLPPNNSTVNVTNQAINEGATTGVRTGDPLRTPLAYPVPVPMQYFRRRGDEDLPLGYPGIYGWNQPSLYGGLAGSGLSGSLAGVPLVPITIGNEVRYVPLNLRMFRQLVNTPVREKDDLMEEDDITPFNAFNRERDTEEAAAEEETTNEGEASPETGYVSLSQRRKQRRRRPLQAITQKMRQVQFL
ncbi:uncharacterized protein LOC110182546 [Drosophila serrata]|uniref:uncharacterized protein LOC110182546 n=1 Tax=Drosophila serrata TaxID=7274 RepID=UPI000A1D12F9|nr:uncharacterized protein LOC110182546 [Drosophila serrata]